MKYFAVTLFAVLVSCTNTQVKKPDPFEVPNTTSPKNETPKDTSEKDPSIFELPFNPVKENSTNSESKTTKNPPNGNGTEEHPAPTTALELQKQLVAKNPDPAEKRKLAFLYLAEGNLLEAEKIISSLPDRNEKLLKFIEPCLLNELGEFKLAQEKLSQLLEDLPLSKLVRIDRIELCRKIMGFRNYDLYGEGGKIKPGHAALIYVEVKNFTTKKTSENCLMHLKYEWELFDDRDKKITVSSWVTSDPKNKEDRKETRGITREFYQSFRLPLPQNLATGNYKIKITVEDALSGKSDSAYVPIYVTDY